MTRCMTLFTFAVIASATFLSKLAHGIEGELEDKQGATHKFDVAHGRCTKFATAIVAVRFQTYSDSCAVFESDDCSSKDMDDRMDFDIMAEIARGEEGFKAMSILCSEEDAQ
ncbi:hypothetical protein DFQ26_000876, partial [Actinomortierella ambigua]